MSPTEIIPTESLYPLVILNEFDITVLRILLYTITIIAVFTCIYLSIFFIKKTVQQLRKKS
jgi:hypothetical protein